MPRTPPFSSASLYIHMQPAMTRAHPARDDMPAAMRFLIDEIERQVDLSLSARLRGLKSLLDEEAVHVADADMA